VRCVFCYLIGVYPVRCVFCYLIGALFPLKTPSLRDTANYQSSFINNQCILCALCVLRGKIQQTVNRHLTLRVILSGVDGLKSTRGGFSLWFKIRVFCSALIRVFSAGKCRRHGRHHCPADENKTFSEARFAKGLVRVRLIRLNSVPLRALRGAKQ